MQSIPNQQADTDTPSAHVKYED